VSDHSPLPRGVVSHSASIDHLPLHVAMNIRERQREEDERIARAAPEIRLLLPIALALARLAAVEDLRVERTITLGSDI